MRIKIYLGGIEILVNLVYLENLDVLGGSGKVWDFLGGSTPQSARYRSHPAPLLGEHLASHGFGRFWKFWRYWKLWRLWYFLGGDVEFTKLFWGREMFKREKPRREGFCWRVDNLF